MIRKPFIGAFLTYASVVATAPIAQAHGIAGNRVFPATLTIDDPAVGDELSLPTFSYQPNGTTSTFSNGFEWDKTLVDHFGFAINDGYSVIHQSGGTAYGWQSLQLTLKYEFLENDPHEILMSAGIIRQFDGTGAARVGATPTGLTTPTLYFGKGLGDLPDAVGVLRPFAITGTFGYQFADQPTQSSGAGGVLQIAHNPNLLVMGLSVQYSIPYLQTQVKDYGLPKFLANVIPIVELAYTTPATAPSGFVTQGTIAPGLLYEGGTYQLGIEALIPATKGSGSGTGFIVQLHFYLDDLFPNSIGRPLFGS